MPDTLTGRLLAVDWSALPDSRFVLIVLLLLALAIDGLLPDLRPLWRVLPHPVRIIGGLTGWLDRHLNRDRRSETDRMIRGLLAVVVVVGLAALAGLGIHRFAFAWPWGWLVELALVVTLLAQHSLFAHVLAVGRALRDDGLAGGRAAVGHIVGRDPARLDEHGVARAAIESCAENWADGVVAPAFWYIVFGLPGLLACKAVNTMDSMIGYRTPRHRSFGFTAARLDDLVNFLPARLSGLMIALAAVFLPTARPVAALRVMRRDARRHRSPNAGWPEAACAGALGLALSGPRSYEDQKGDEPWIGDGTARARPVDISRAVGLCLVASLVHGLLIAGLAVLSQTLTAG